MKKLIISALLIAGIAGTTFAQDAPPTGKRTNKKEVKSDKKADKGKPAKSTKKQEKSDKKDSMGK